MKRSLIYFSVISFLFLGISCKKDDGEIPIEVIMDPEPEPKDTITEPIDTDESAKFFNQALTDDSYILLNDAAANRAYIMDKNAELLHEWPLNGQRIGNDLHLQANGKLLAMLEAEDPKIELGGFGGSLKILDKDGGIDWEFDYSSDDYILHHDAEILPNGNIITQVWERKSKEEGQAAGYNLDVELFPDAIIEIDTVTKEIVWEWHVWDHLIQNIDDNKNNFGVVSDNPQRININYVQQEDGDITHANAITYDATKDVIYLSVNFYSEVWVIDHSTTTEQAATSSGGNYDKGGDLVYRFGNPSAYDNQAGERLFHNNHFPNLFDSSDKSKMLIFSNGAELEQSTVYELKLPGEFDLVANQDNEPEVVWSFTDSQLFSPKVSGAVRLPNGNTLITEGDFGIWEVTSEGELVWQFKEPGFFWRAYFYEKNAPEIIALGL